MPLESGSYLSDLVITNPTSGDPKSQGDDHLRLIKSTLRVSFSGFLGAVVVRGTDTGTGAAYVVAPSTAIPSLQVGMRVQFAPVNANTGPATLAVSGLAATPIVHANGSALTAGDIPAGRLLEVAYDGTSFQIVGGSGFIAKTGNQTINGTLTTTGNFTSGGTGTFNGTGTSSFAGGINAAGALVLSGTLGNVTAPGTGTNDFSAGRTLAKTLPFGTPNSDDVVTVQLLNQAAFSNALPAQLVDGPRYLRSWNSVVSWEYNSLDLFNQSIGVI